MIVNKSMFPLQTGFGVISKMQDKFATLQMQLGTGEKASTLSEMGRDLPMSLSVRARLSKIEGFSANIDTVKLRLSFLDKTMSRLDSIEGEARNSAVQGQYGTNNINMATLPSLSKARLDEVVTLLNSDVAGRYLFGGANTDAAPLPDTDTLLNGQGGKAGFKTVLTERKAADAGLDGRGRLASSQAVGTSTVSLAEDGVHPFGMKLSTMSTTSSSVTVTQPAAGTLPLGDQVDVTFAPTPAAQIIEGQSISMGFSLPDGSETQITLRAVDAANATGAVDEFVIGADAEATAANFKTTLDAKLVEVGNNVLAGASTFAASENFYNGPGEPVLRVQGNPATATALRVADDTDTIMWYSGQSPAVSAQGLGRLEINTAADTVTLGEKAPVSDKYGFQIGAVSAATANISTTYTATDPSAVAVKFNAVPAAGESVDITLTDPAGVSRTVTVTAVVGKAGPGQFTIGADVNSTATNFAASLKGVVGEAAAAAEGNPRQSVTSQVDDSTRVSYGIEANESGFLRLVRTLSALSVETYPDSDPSSKARFDTMAKRQQSELSEGHNSEQGSIEIVTMQLAVAHNALDNSAKRHTDYKSQLDNLLSDVETVSKEDVAMEIMALQTRLQASYQVTSMVSKLSLVNFL
jgi:flagellar hook-associated protein 3 FlgL